ncbi:agmatinase [Patulibacter defluvii]|uniref:agmatinase n=1 Tax=Patulibacter defluvii TaxID=3095358 RepID=UPI002A74858D|nr:agmatinase [Patulibacter sp. DM4]
MYEPTDALSAPRFTGPRTFARLPHVPGVRDADVAVFGMPWDGAATFRAGARSGPEAIRSASALLRPYNPGQGVQVFGALSVADAGDAPTVPGYIEQTLSRIEAFVHDLAAGGTIPVGLGGDHSVTLAELRALHRIHGPLGLVHLDAHGDLWDEYFGLPYNHGTVFRRALEEGLIDPARTLQAGMRGSLYGPEDADLPAQLGLQVLPWDELAQLSPEQFGQIARERVGDGPTFLTFDVDVVDPAFAPGTGTPEVGGPTSHEVLRLLRSLTGIDFRGFDVVEVAAPYDGPGQPTALVAATAAYEMLSLLARRRAATGVTAG